MLVQAGLCRTCSETTLLVFPRGGSFTSYSQAQYDAAEMITQRETVSHKVSENLTERAASFGIMLDDISLVRFGLFSALMSVTQS